jgi:hypothetical protein
MSITVTWNATYEDEPAGTDNITNGDDEIRELKTAVREGLERELTWSLTDTSSKRGIFRAGAARIYTSSAEPTTKPDGTTSLDSDDSGRLWFDPVNTTLAVRSGSWKYILGKNDIYLDQELTDRAIYFAGITRFIRWDESADIFETSHPVKVANDNIALRVKHILVLEWDMNSNATWSTSHGLTVGDIRSVQVMLKKDSAIGTPDTPVSFEDAGHYEIDGGTLTLTRDSGGKFDSTDYDSTDTATALGGYRGDVLIYYED